MKSYVCAYCNHEVISNRKPEPIKWTDGHVCRFVEVKEDRSNIITPKKKIYRKKKNT